MTIGNNPIYDPSIFNPTPPIFQQETSGANTSRNQGLMGQVTVVVSSAGDTEVIPFTKFDNRNKWQYKSESNIPTLKPSSVARDAGANPTTHDDAWLETYDNNYGQLEPDVRAALEGTPTLNGGAMVAVLEVFSRVQSWMGGAEAATETESAQNLSQYNQQFPNAAFVSSVHTGSDLADSAAGILDTLGPNDPSYLDAQGFVNNMITLLNEIKHP